MRRSLRTAYLLCWACAVPTYAAPAPPTLGAPAPDFTAVNMVTGEKMNLSAQRGTLVVLTFWASWCGPCRKELPVLENLQRKVGKDKLMVYAVSFHESQEAARTVRKDAKSQSWLISLLDDPNDHIAKAYAIHGIPHLCIIGTDGRILAVHTGYGESSIQELVDEINAAFKAAGSGRTNLAAQ